jgi:O-antigen/teichoic acid export membrane protein
MLLTSFTQQFLGQIEILFLGRMTTMAEVGLFSVANRISMLCRIPNNVVGMVISPLIAKVYASGEKDELESMVHIGALAGFLGGALLSLPLAIWPGMVLEVFGHEYVAARYLLLLLIAGNLVHSFFGPNGQLLMMTGNELFVFKVMASSIAVDIALNLSLIPIWGAMGAAMAATVTLILRNIVFNLACKRRIGMAPYAKLSRRSIQVVRSMISR